APARLRPRPAGKRRWPKALAIATALMLAWLLWPAAPEPDAGGAALATKLAGAAKAPDKPEKPEKPGKLPDSAADKLKPSSAGGGAVKAAPRPPPPAARLRAQRDLLLAAVRSRAATLRPCVPGGAVELRVPVRLHLVRSGTVKSVDFSG